MFKKICETCFYGEKFRKKWFCGLEGDNPEWATVKFDYTYGCHLCKVELVWKEDDSEDCAQWEPKED